MNSVFCQTNAHEKNNVLFRNPCGKWVLSKRPHEKCVLLNKCVWKTVLFRTPCETCVLLRHPYSKDSMNEYCNEKSVWKNVPKQ